MILHTSFRCYPIKKTRMGKKKAIGGRKSVKIKKAVAQKAKPIYNSDDDIPDEKAERFHKDDIDIYNEQRMYYSLCR